MKPLNHKINNFFIYLLFVVIMSPLIGCSDNETIQITDYFPLSSSWETDKWTLFVDENEHIINGVSTFAMVNTRDAEAKFWTNDKGGLRLHGVWNPDERMIVFSKPILFSTAFSRVGERNETRYAQNGEQLIFSSELLGFENITIPAGTFHNCLKYRIHVYPVASVPEEYGNETLWLAKNVGFVKAQNDVDSYSYLFAKQGETRELISYHTLSELLDEEETVRQAYTQWVNCWNAQNITDLTNMVHDGYYEKCRDKTEAIAYWKTLMADRDNFKMFTSIEDVNIVGDNAYVLREYHESYMDLLTTEPIRQWGRSTVRLKRDALGEWKIFGDQLENYPNFISVYPRVTPSDTTFASPVEITNCATGEWSDTDDQIASLTVSGAPESDISDFPIPWDPIPGWNGFWWEFDIESAKSGFHTFELIDVNGNHLVYTDYLMVSEPLDMPFLVSPSDGAVGVSTHVTFEWEPVAGANRYKVEVYDGATKVISESTGQTTYNAILDSDTTYDWRVRARYYDPNDGSEYDSESRSVFQSFTTSP